MAAYVENLGLAGSFVCPALPHCPEQAVALIESHLCAQSAHAVTLVGSSLGGYYATWAAEKYACRAILIQPAVFPHVGLEQSLGRQQNLYTGEEYELTRAHLQGWRDLWVEEVDPERYLLLLETGDEVLDYRDAVRRYEGARMVLREGGDHTLASFPEHLPRMLTFAGLRP